MELGWVRKRRAGEGRTGKKEVVLRRERECGEL